MSGYTFFVFIFQINAEFMGIIAVPLETKFFTKLDELFPKLLEIIRSKGGRVKEKILQILDKVLMTQNVYLS